MARQRNGRRARWRQSWICMRKLCARVLCLGDCFVRPLEADKQVRDAKQKASVHLPDSGVLGVGKDLQCLFTALERCVELEGALKAGADPECRPCRVNVLAGTPIQLAGLLELSTSLIRPILLQVLHPAPGDLRSASSSIRRHDPLLWHLWHRRETWSRHTGCGQQYSR